MTTKTFYNEEYEKIILGVLLLDNSLIDIVSGKLDKECFFNAKYRFIYENIIKQWKDNHCVDLISLTTSLSAIDRTEIVTLTDCVPSTSNWEFYVSKVREYSLTRNFKNELNSVLATLDADKINDTVNGLETKLATFLQYGSNGVDFKNLCEDVAKEIYDANQSQKKYLGFETGFEQLDEILDGFQTSQMYVIGARPSIGKTAFALTILRKLAERGVPSDMFSLEMSDKQCFYRMLASESKLPMWQLRKGTCMSYKQGMSKLQIGLNKLFAYPINIIDQSINDNDIISRIRYEAVVKGKKVFVVDHLGLIQISNPTAQHYLDVGKITAQLHALSKELDICIILLCQMNREAEGKKPNLSLLRESGNIEQDADVIMLLYRERDLEEDNIPTQVIVEKNRDGKTGYAKFIFNKQIQDFTEDKGFKNDEVAEAPKVPVANVREEYYEEEALPF